jgi:chromosomal replication initiation ATPase DnaA
LCTRIEQLSEAIRRVLRRCNDNGGEIDAELVRELKAAIGDD